MGTGDSKHENVVADTIDRSHNLSKDFTVLRSHGDTGPLIAGSLANFLQLYIIYRGVLWKRSRMLRAREEAEDGPRAVWAGPGRVVRRAPHEKLSSDCRDIADYMAANKFVINADKTHLMAMAPSRLDGHKNQVK